jgi:hypothetical protein
MGKLLEIRVSRTSAKGLEFFIRSTKEWSLVGNSDMTCVIGGVECYYPQNMHVQDCIGRFGIDDVFDFGDTPNLTMLLAKNIKEGVTFNFGKYPISEEKIKNWLQTFKEQAKCLYFTYIKDIDISVIFTTNLVENDRQD